mgnify:FL=1
MHEGDPPFPLQVEVVSSAEEGVSHRLFHDRELCDLTLRVSGGEEIPAHSLVLRCQSPFFRSMMDPGLSWREQETHSVNLQEWDASVMLEAKRCMYLGHVCLTSSSQLQQLLLLAGLLQLTTLEKQLTELLCTLVDEHTCVSLLCFAMNHNVGGSVAQRAWRTVHDSLRQLTLPQAHKLLEISSCWGHLDCEELPLSELPSLVHRLLMTSASWYNCLSLLEFSMEHQLTSEENEVLYQRCMELVQEFTPEALDPARIAWWSSSQKEAHEVGSIKSVEHILQHANRLSSVSEDHLWHSLLAWAEFRQHHLVDQRHSCGVGELLQPVLSHLDIPSLSEDSVQELLHLGLRLPTPLPGWKTPRTFVQLPPCLQRIGVDSQLPLSGTSKEALGDALTQGLDPSVTQQLQDCELLFRASQHSFSSRAFHQCCDGHAHTVVLVRSTGGSLFGGYSGCTPWESPRQVGGAWRSSHQTSFLFSLQHPGPQIQTGVPYPCRDPARELRMGAGLGPSFGAGADLSLAHHGHLNRRSMSALGHSFGGPEEVGRFLVAQPSSQEDGDPIPPHFTPAEYEVWGLVLRE